MKVALKHLLVGFSFMVFSRIFSYSIYSLIFYPDLAEYTRLYRPMQAWQWPLLLPTDLIVGTIFSVIYSFVKNNLSKPMCPFTFAAIYAILTKGVGEFANYIVFPMSAKVMFAGIAVGLCTFLCTAFVVKAINKKKPNNINT